MKLEELGLTDEQLEEVQKILQSETDKVRTEKTQEIKVLQDKLDEHIPVEETPEEIALRDRVEALEDREKELDRKEQHAQLIKQFENEGLDKQLVDFLDLEKLQGAEMETHLQGLKGILNAQSLGSSYKPSEHKQSKDLVTKEQFDKMGYNERVNLKETNENLYNKLSE